jgi:hypothetical protein
MPDEIIDLIETVFYTNEDKVKWKDFEPDEDPDE